MFSLTLCEATASNTKLRKPQSYKSVFYQNIEALLLILQPYLVWKLLSHWSRKTNPKVRGTLKSLPKIVSKRSHQEECVHSRQNREVWCFLRCISSSPGLWQTSKLSPTRHSPLRSKDRRPSHAVVEIAAGIERWQTVHSQLSKPDTKTRTAYNSSVGRGDEGKRNFGGLKRQLFLQNKGLFKASTASLVSQLHAREKWRPYGNQNYQKIRLEFTQVAIDRNRSMASQRVKVLFTVLYRKIGKIWHASMFLTKTSRANLFSPHTQLVEKPKGWLWQSRCST